MKYTINAEGRALHFLLNQGFTLYSVPAAVCTRIAYSRQLLDNTEHAWAVYFTPDALTWTPHMVDEDPLKAVFSDAAVRSSSPGTPHVLCHAAGGAMLVPLTVPDVRDIRVRIESAVTMRLAPPPERLEAYPDELIEREAKRRAKKKKREEGKSSDEPNS